MKHRSRTEGKSPSLLYYLAIRPVTLAVLGLVKSFDHFLSLRNDEQSDWLVIGAVFHVKASDHTEACFRLGATGQDGAEPEPWDPGVGGLGRTGGAVAGPGGLEDLGAGYQDTA